MADIEKVKQGLRCCKSCLKSHCEECPHNGEGDTFDCTADLANDALSVIEELQAEIERLQPKVAKWITVRYIPQNIEFKRCTCCDYLCMGWDGETGVEYDYCPNCGAKMD